MLHFVVNLDRDSERLKAMEQELGQYGLSFERLPAVYGRDLPPEALKKAQVGAKNRRFWLKDLTFGQIGCYFSHVNAWKRLVESTEEWAFIQEDDIKFNVDPRPYLTNTDWIPEGVKLIQAARYKNKHEVYRKRTVLPLPGLPGEQKLMQITADQIGGTMGYFIHRDVAQYLIEHSSPIIAPVDDLLFFHPSPLHKIFTAWTLNCALVIDNDEGISNTQEKTPPANRVINYWLYGHRHLLKMKNKLLCLLAYKKDVLR